MKKSEGVLSNFRKIMAALTEEIMKNPTEDGVSEYIKTDLLKDRDMIETEISYLEVKAFSPLNVPYIERVIKSLEKNKLPTKVMKGSALPRLHEVIKNEPLERQEEIWRSVAELAEEMAAKGKGPCSTIGQGVLFCVKASKGRGDLLRNLNELREFVLNLPFDPFETFLYGEALIVKFANDPRSLRHAFMVSRKIPEWFKKARDMGFRDDKLREEVRSIIIRTPSLQLFEKIIDDEIASVGGSRVEEIVSYKTEYIRSIEQREVLVEACNDPNAVLWVDSGMSWSRYNIGVEYYEGVRMQKGPPVYATFALPVTTEAIFTKTQGEAKATQILSQAMVELRKQSILDNQLEPIEIAA